ncbi:uncharacterized protein Z519_08565 [Cladophialophora bantiana CBS 173.52]|uniref:Uncharacterized protein n=1 Tax=Cladophialophora bantiana (strain ATCC 10958 / CBS 173.52 / CDC B-1940 / NIH 8579) TaxID=1442370 RepID=A0A0D2FW74_CLAB1|nr:uncharacterized protein Z519_08565 [Cladophialophora bantiana CBS 173.52]KIW90782.1 hypothetical protein Z519_08565 [Cladophialophora bantiana CBS 173.52]
MVLPPSAAAPTNRGEGVAGDSEDIWTSPSTQPPVQDSAAATSDKTTAGWIQQEQDLARAIQLSLQDQAQAGKRTDTRMGSSQHLSSSDEPSLDLVLSLNNEFTALADTAGDTAIYFGPPPQMPEQNDKDYHYIRQHFDRVHVVKSTNLRLMGDESKFTDRNLLHPTESLHAESKLRKLGVLNKAEAAHGGKFKYYIDLRPPNEDEEAVILITDLTCTRGVLTWHLARHKYDLSPLAVQGHDEFGIQPHADPLAKRLASSENTGDADPSPSNTAKPKSNQSSDDKAAPPVPTALDYSPLRHWSALERMLQAIQGNDPKLDSAPKVWTFFAIARYFGCATHERISGWIMTWLYAGNNSNFIQNNPEVAYRIGMGIRSADLIKDSFSILVGERALIEACGELNPDILTRRRQSVHGRKLELLDDDERNRIDHAASSFVKRIRQMVCSICKDMDFLHESPTYAILDNAVGQTPRGVEALKTTKNVIKDYIRWRVYHVLCQNQGNFSNLESDPKSTLPFRTASSEDYGVVYGSLNQRMRQLTKTFWIALQHMQLDEGSYNTSSQSTIGWSDDTQYLQALPGLYKDDPFIGIAQIPRGAFVRTIEDLNQMFWNREVVHGTPSAKRRKTNELDDFTLPFRDRNNSISSSIARIQTSPSWRTLLPKKAQTTTAPSTEPPAFALRPKPTSTGHVLHQVNNYEAGSATESQQGLSTRTNLIVLNTAPVSDASESRFVQGTRFENNVSAELTAPLPINPNWAAPTVAADASAFASNTFFNPYTGRDEGLNLPREEDRTRCVQPPPPTPRSSNRVKQAFSNSNTDAEGTIPPSYHSPISPEVLLKELTTAIESICSKLIYPPHLFHETGLLPTDLFDSLLCLNTNEFRYLPLWVPDGDDDDTGGVFEEEPVPNLDPVQTGFESFGPGRIKRGFDQADTEASSEIDEITSSQAVSTLGKASKFATDGTRTVKSMSSISTIDVNRETIVFTGLNDSEGVAHSVVHVGKDVMGTEDEADSDMLSIDDFDDDGDNVDEGVFDDGDSDSDMVNWDNERATELHASSNAIGNSNQERTGRGHDQGPGQGASQLRRAQHNLNDESQNTNIIATPDFETIVKEVSYDKDKRWDKEENKDNGIGKAKTQNFPYSFILPDLPSHSHETASQPEPDPFAHDQSYHGPHPHNRSQLQPHPHSQHDQDSSSSSVVLIETGDNGNDNRTDNDAKEKEDDDGFEFI